MVQDIDHVFSAIDGFGRFHLVLLAVLGTNMFTISNHALISTFTSGEPPWRCRVNSSKCTLANEIRPTDDMYMDRCDLDREDWEFVNVYTSIVTEWDLVCNKSILGSISTSVYFAGFLAGVICLGFLSDSFGRWKMMIVSALTVALVGTISAYSPSLTLYSVCRFLIGFSGGGCILVIFVLASELSDVENRGLIGTSLWYFFCFSNMLLALMAYLIRDWRYLTLANSMPGFIAVITLWWIPESPRWLLVQGRKNEAECILRRIAQTNGKTYPQEPLKVPCSQEENKRAGSILDMFRSCKTAKHMTILWLSWFVNGMVYYGVSMSGDSIGGDIYSNFLLLSAIEIPAIYTTIKVMNRCGRKFAVVGGLVIAAFAALVTASIPYNNTPGAAAGRVIGSVAAKYAITVSFDSVYVLSAELIPTSIRSAGMGTCSATARIGCFTAPYVLWLQRLHATAPFGIMSISSLIAGTLCLTLPETKDKPVPEVISIHREREEGYEELKNLDR